MPLFNFNCFYFFSSSNLNINDVLGNYSLTLVDALDTLAVSVQPYRVLKLRCRGVGNPWFLPGVTVPRNLALCMFLALANVACFNDLTAESKTGLEGRMRRNVIPPKKMEKV